MQSGLNEIGRRLHSLMNKMGARMGGVRGEEVSIADLKDLIYEIDEKVQQI